MMVVRMKDQRGQALIELIIFLPLIVTLYSVISGFAGAINGSINQQKIARSYFYFRVQNNSTIPFPAGSKSNWKIFGFYFIGWMEQFYSKADETPVHPCYKVSIPFKDDVKDKCDEAYTDTRTLWVRVGTVYGVCGATYMNDKGQTFLVPDSQGLDFKLVTDRNSCVITE